MSWKILLSPPDVGLLEQEYVLRALQSGWIAPAGPDLDAFEAELAERAGVGHAVGLSSATAGLHLALVEWGVRAGDVVVVPTLTFAATVNAVRYVGAQPHLVDCDPVTGNLDPALLAQALDRLAAQGRRVGAVLTVDLFGRCVDYTRVGSLLAERGIPLLCDAAESFGASHAGRPAGCFGAASVVSFNGNKVMTTSGGGVLLTDDAEHAAHVRKLATQAREPVAHYEHTEVGYNYRLSNILAALGRAQLSRLEEMIDRRRHWRHCYRQLLAGVAGVSVLGGGRDDDDNCWLTVVVVDEQQAGWSASHLAETLGTSHIETRQVWKPMHLQPVNRDCSTTLDGSAEYLFDHGLVLPSGSAMSESDFDLVAEAIGTVTQR